nr:hypothetical protein [Tanacetum cinerariifolium]
MAQLRCSNCGGLFNSRTYPSCSIVGSENECVHDPNPLPYDNTPDFSYQPPQHHVDTYLCELCGNDSHYGYDCPPRFPLVYEQEPLDGDDDDDDYDKESIISTNTNIFETPSSDAITTSSPIEDLEDSLIMGNKDLSTIPKKESNEFIKSSVEDLVPIPKSVTFSNSLFNSNDDFISSDDESLSDKDVSKDNVKIYLKPFFKFDDGYICSDVNPLFDKVLEDIECKDSYDPNLDESTFLVTPLFDVNEDECFDSRGDVDKINDFEDGYYTRKETYSFLRVYLMMI